MPILLGLTDLPPEILTQIISNLKLRDRFSVAYSCKTLEVQCYYKNYQWQLCPKHCEQVNKD